MVYSGIHNGTLLFNINALVIFIEQKNLKFAAYAQDNTLYFCLFSSSYVKMNSGKCHLVLSPHDKNNKINLSGEVTNNAQMQKPLVVYIDYKIKFDTHIETQCKKLEKISSALAQYIKYMSTNHAQLLMRSFIIS